MPRARGEWRVVEVQETGENGYIGGSFPTREAAQKKADELRAQYAECRFFPEWLDLSDPDDFDDDYYPDDDEPDEEV